MKEILKKYWWAIVLIIVLPILINLIIICPSFFKVGGRPNDWLTFFGGYIGCIISASVPFVILYKTIRNNEMENKANRQLQVNILTAELAQSRLNDIRNILSRLICAYESEDLMLVASCLENDSQSILQTIKRIGTNVRVENTNLRLALNAMANDNSRVFLKEVETFNFTFRVMLMELVWMAEYSPINIQYDEWDNEIYDVSAKQIEKDVNEFLNRMMEENPEIDKHDAYHIWNIFKKYDFAHNKFEDIWTERILHFDIPKFEQMSIDYIDEELKTIKSRL